MAKFNEIQKVINKKLDYFEITNYLLNLEQKNDKDKDTGLHENRVMIISEEIARSLNMQEKNIEKLMLAARCHDFGKIFIDNNILNKNGKLTEEEFNIIKNHPKLGYDIMSKEVPEEIREVALYHHEKYNGKGYPTALKGEDIPFFARIVQIADVYDALISKRSYKNSKTEEEVLLKMIDKESNFSFDPFLIRQFIKIKLNDQKIKESFSIDSINKLSNFSNSNPMNDISEDNNGWVIKKNGYRIKYDINEYGNKQLSKILNPLYEEEKIRNTNNNTEEKENRLKFKS